MILCYCTTVDTHSRFCYAGERMQVLLCRGTHASRKNNYNLVLGNEGIIESSVVQ